MAIESKQVTITTEPALLVGNDNVRRDVLLHAKHVSYIGNEGVTTSNGFLLDNGDEFRLTLFEGEVLYGVGSSGSGTMYVLISAQS
jgi:hypothetical protein